MLRGAVALGLFTLRERVVGEVGLEPTRRNRHGLLRPACLPISALAQFRDVGSLND